MTGSTNNTIPVGATIVVSEGTDKVLSKIDASKAYTSEYFLADSGSNYKLLVSNTFKGNDSLRNYVQFKHITPATDEVPEKVSTVTVSIDGLISENSDLADMVLGIRGWLTNANVALLRGGQS